MCRFGLSGGKVKGMTVQPSSSLIADQRDRRQVGAARLLRHVERPQAELLAGLQQRAFFLRRQPVALALGIPA